MDGFHKPTPDEIKRVEDMAERIAKSTGESRTRVWNRLVEVLNTATTEEEAYSRGVDLVARSYLRGSVPKN